MARTCLKSSVKKVNFMCRLTQCIFVKKNRMVKLHICARISRSRWLNGGAFSVKLNVELSLFVRSLRILWSHLGDILLIQHYWAEIWVYKEWFSLIISLETTLYWLFENFEIVVICNDVTKNFFAESGTLI